LELIFFKALIILFESVPQLIILLDFTLPFCLSPISIVATLKLGASKIPLDELPTTPLTYCNKDKYSNLPKVVNAKDFFYFY
tara:strand:+ start:490 stop:735 length:246 start_codon:yes stop_codon:yes gene_type:complete